MKRIVEYAGSRTQYVPALGCELKPGRNELHPETAAMAMKLGLVTEKKSVVQKVPPGAVKKQVKKKAKKKASKKKRTTKKG
jgi:hypothetical protein